MGIPDGEIEGVADLPTPDHPPPDGEIEGVADLPTPDHPPPHSPPALLPVLKAKAQDAMVDSMPKTPMRTESIGSTGNQLPYASAMLFVEPYYGKCCQRNTHTWH